MAKFYVHVRLFEATQEQSQAFVETMLKFHYKKTIQDTNEDDLRLLPGGYILDSTMECRQITSQTFSIANTVGVDADIFVCEFQRCDHQLPVASLIDNGYTLRGRTF